MPTDSMFMVPRYQYVTCFICSPSELPEDVRTRYGNPSDADFFNEIRIHFNRVAKPIDNLKKFVAWFPDRHDDIYLLVADNLGLYKKDPENFSVLISLFPKKNGDLWSKFRDLHEEDTLLKAMRDEPRDVSRETSLCALYSQPFDIDAMSFPR